MDSRAPWEVNAWVRGITIGSRSYNDRDKYRYPFPHPSTKHQLTR